MDALDARLLTSLRRREARRGEALWYSAAELARDFRVSKAAALASLLRLHEQRAVVCFKSTHQGVFWRVPIYAGERGDSPITTEQKAA